MIKQSDKPVSAYAIRGGEGEARIFAAPLPQGAAPIGTASRIELEPGASIGEHIHIDDEEVYAVMSGTGIYCADGREIPAAPGDIFVTRKGMSHGLKNSGDTPLVFFAVVAK